MANKTINDLTATTSMATGDFLVIWRAANGDTRKVTKANALGGVLTGGGTIATGGFTLTVGATSTINGSVVGNISGGGTIATGGFTLTLSSSGTLALGGFTLTVPATGTAALLGTAQTFTALKTFSAGLTFGGSTLNNYVVNDPPWLPVIGGSSLNPALTYTAQSGNYQRIGNWVLFSLSVTVSNISSGGSGDIRVTLPVTAADFDLVTVSVNGIDLPGTPASLVGVTLGGAANMILSVISDNGATATVQHTGLSNGDNITATGIYRVA